MDKERTAGILMFTIICAFVSVYFMSRLRSSFELNGTQFVQVGVMEINDNGKTLYAPVYRKTSK